MDTGQANFKRLGDPRTCLGLSESSSRRSSIELHDFQGTVLVLCLHTTFRIAQALMEAAAIVCCPWG